MTTLINILNLLCFLKIYLFYLFIFGCIGSHCCPRAFSSCGERGLLFDAVHGLLIVVASPGHISGENHNPKRYMHPNVHSSIIYNSQDMEAT